jgi:hypothetical protein
MRISIKTAAALIACSSSFLAYGPAQAGPCTTDIAQFEATVRQSGGDPDSGLMARQSIKAQLSRQPTPRSVEQAENQLQTKFAARIARARRLDAEGNAGCIRALNAAKRLYIP